MTPMWMTGLLYSHSYHSLHTHAWYHHVICSGSNSCCRTAAGKCLWPWCGTGRSHRKGGAGSGSFRSPSIDASRPSPGFSQDRCSFRIRSRNWARTPRTRIFAHFLHHDACWMYCFVEFSSWFYTSERDLLWFLVRMLEVIDYTECSRICIVVYCWVSTIRFSLLTSMISINCHYIVSVPLPSVISQIDSPHGARSLELRGASPGKVVNMIDLMGWHFLNPSFMRYQCLCLCCCCIGHQGGA